MKRVAIKGKTFKGDLSRGKASNALGFMWRPGMPKESILIENCTIDAGPVAEGLKLSYCHDVVVKDSVIIGGFEDCVDIVRGGSIKFIRCKFISKNTKHHFTIKCMVDDIQIMDCTFINNFRTIIDGAFVDLGNWSDYDIDVLPKTKNILISNCKFENVSWWKRLISRRLYSETPVVDGPGFIFKVPNFAVRIFWALRRYQVKAEK